MLYYAIRYFIFLTKKYTCGKINNKLKIKIRHYKYFFSQLRNYFIMIDDLLKKLFTLIKLHRQYYDQL